MNIVKTISAALLLIGGCVVAADAADLNPTPELEPTPAVNADVVHTDHGDGLGPNGEDLHYHERDEESPRDDAEITRQALEQPAVIEDETEDDLAATIEETVAP